MSGERNLSNLIKNLKPELHPGKYAFVSLKEGEQIPSEGIISVFHEDEGISLVIRKELADKLGLSSGFIAAWITLKVHSSLEAVGLTAKVAKALADAGISCNAIAAYYHDHIFVPYRSAEKALSILRKLT